MAAGPRSKVNDALSRLRLAAADQLELIDPEAFAFTCLAYFGLEFTSRRARSRSTAATTTGAAGVESSRPERAGPEQIEFHNVSAG